jgi:hypothetical protein
MDPVAGHWERNPMSANTLESALLWDDFGSVSSIGCLIVRKSRGGLRRRRTLQIAADFVVQMFYCDNNLIRMFVGFRTVSCVGSVRTPQ